MSVYFYALAFTFYSGGKRDLVIAAEACPIAQRVLTEGVGVAGLEFNHRQAIVDTCGGSNLKLTYVTQPDGTLFNISLALLFASSLWLIVRNWSNISVPNPISTALVVCIISFSIATAYCLHIYKMEKNASVDVKALACDKTLTELDFDARKFDADFEKAIIWKCGVGSYQKFIIDARAEYLKKGQRVP